jgi:hypothetical protein
MRKLTLSLAAAGMLLSGCIAVPYDAGGHGYYRQHGGHGYHGPYGRAHRDRDGDGVANRHDRAPRNPYRY